MVEIAMRPSDATMKGRMHLPKRFITGQGNDLCFPTAVNQRDGFSLIPFGEPPKKIKINYSLAG
jgi:hypothetical protein